MSARTLLKGLGLLSAGLAVAWLVAWRRESVIDDWLMLAFVVSFAATFVVSLLGSETRPRAMLRFLSALCALIAAIAIISDWTGPVHQPSPTLLGALSASMPTLVASLESTVIAAFGPVAWSSVITSLLDQPTWLIFAVLALLLGYAGRPRHRVQIYVN
jgi:hypothetical protein